MKPQTIPPQRTKGVIKQSNLLEVVILMLGHKQHLPPLESQLKVTRTQTKGETKENKGETHETIREVLSAQETAQTEGTSRDT